jgi:hypothetical protein
MAYVPIAVNKEAGRTVAGGTHHVAGTFVPAYDTPTAIRLPEERPRYQTFERRQPGRSIRQSRRSS